MNITGHRIPHRLVVVSVLAATLYLLPLGFDGATAAASGLSACRAVIDAPTSASGGSAVAIADRSVAPKGAALTSRAWFFGDGASLSGESAGATVDHTYPVPASRMTKKYSIRLLLSFSNGAQCSAVAPILIINGAQQKGFTKLDLRGSTITQTLYAPIPNCGVMDATMHWMPRFGIEEPANASGAPVLLLFGTAVITSGGLTEREPEEIGVHFTGLPIAGAVLKYANVAYLNKIEEMRPCVKMQYRAFGMVSVVSYPFAKFKNGNSKLKCMPATATKKASCKIDPSKTLYITGAESTANITDKADLHVYFAKATCAYVGPANASPFTPVRARWYKCK